MNHRRRFLRLIIPFLIASLLFGALYLIAVRAQPVQADLVPTADGDVVIGPDGITENADPGDVVTYTNWITNDRPTEENITLEYANDENWPVVMSTNSLTIPGRLSDSVIITVTVPITANAGPVTTTVTATTSASGSDTDTANNVTIVNAIPDVEMAAQDDTLSGDPDQIIFYIMEISNTGNADDTYNIEVAGGAQGFVTTSQPTITVSSGQSDNFNVSVQIPVDADAGIMDTATVTATSSISPTLVDEQQLTTSVNTRREVVIVPDEINRSGDPGNQVTFNHTVENRGNVNETYNIEAESDLLTFTVQISADELSVPKFDSRPLTVVVHIPAGTPEGIVNVTTITVTSSANTNIFDIAEDTTTVEQVSGVDIEKDETDSGDPGTTIQYIHTVTNTGNVVDTYTITIESSQMWTSADKDTLTIARGQSKTVTIDVDIPFGSDSSQEEITTVTATSQKDPSKSDGVEDKTTVNRHLLFLPMISTPSTWQQVGADSWDASDDARAISVDVCSTDDDLIFAGTGSEIRIFDGDSWSPAGGDAPNDSLIGGVVLNKDCDTVYVGSFASSESSATAESGVWEGSLDDADRWVWTKLEGGGSVVTVRAIVLADGKLFAAGGFGIAYWEDNQWKASSIAAPKVVTDMTVADPVENEGPIYAVIWMDPKIYRNVDPGGQPGQFATIPGINDLPEGNRSVLAVAGDDSNVRYIGTQTKHYQLNGTVWAEVHGEGARAFSINGADFAGYVNPVDNVPGDGVYFKWQAGGSFVPYNEGWGPPEDVFDLANVSGNLYAATSDGVFLHKQ